jgi:hypothetical protein
MPALSHRPTARPAASRRATVDLATPDRLQYAVAVAHKRNSRNLPTVILVPRHSDYDSLAEGGLGAASSG